MADDPLETTKVVTLSQVGFTFGVGLATLAVTLFLFGVAVRLRCTNIAPRCQARPREVIYNPNILAEAAQKRGPPLLLGWVFWVLGLDYEQLISGVLNLDAQDLVATFDDIHNVLTVFHLTKHRVLMVKVRSWAVSDEEL